MQWMENFKFIIDNVEYIFTNNPSELEVIEDEIKEEARNVSGKKIKSFIKGFPTISLTIPNCDEEEINKLVSIKNMSYDFKKFIISDGLRIKDEIRISESKTKINLGNTSRVDIVILGVWLYSDINKTGTNYMIGGAFDEASKIITLGTMLPSENTKVRIDYSYKGWEVDITDFTITYSAEKPMVGDVAIEMEGV